MTVDRNIAPPSGDRKLQMHVDDSCVSDKHLQKSRRLLQSTSYIYPILLGLLLIISTTLLIITIARRNTCRQLQDKQIESSSGLLSTDHTLTWVPCIKTSKSSSCVCPASFIHSSLNPSHCIPSHSRCLQSCKHNHHCVCHNLLDAHRCLEVTRNWIENEFQIGSVEHFHNLISKNILHNSWFDHSNRQIEQLLVDTKLGERLYFSSDQQTGITIHQKDDDYLLNERWTKIDINTTKQHIIYTQINPQTHSCRMSVIYDDESITHGSIHTCPGTNIGAPYFFGIACHDILVLWHGSRQSKLRRQEGWAVSRHNFESVIPHLPVLLDPFHRYYSLYDDLMIEIKDLNGDVLAQLFTEIHDATKFEFIDQYGTILVANQTHMQLLSSINKETWLDI